MTTPTAAYDASSIESREGLVAMRGTPTLYFPDLEWPGITHSALEVIANGNDEMVAFPHPDAKLTVVICRDRARNTFQWIIRDNGRGIPYEIDPADGKSVFIKCLTKPHTSGKFHQDSYAISAGQFGVGLKATTAMSRTLRAITYRPNGTASLTVHEGDFNPVPLVDPDYRPGTGTTIVFEPDSSIFADVDGYANQGYMLVVSLLRQMVFFRFRNIEFRMTEEPIDPGFWDDPSIPTADNYIRGMIDRAPVIWSAKTNNADEWIRSYWNLHRNFTWTRSIEMSLEEKEAFETGSVAQQRLKDVILKLYYVKGDRTGGTFALVNSVPIPDRSSDHIAVVAGVLRDALALRIPDAPERQWFLDKYPLPLFYAVNVDYKGAKFSNAQKTAFKEVDFREIYTGLVRHWFMEKPEGISIADSLYKLLAQDIHTKYLDSFADKTSRTDMSRLFIHLNKPDNFTDAEPPNGDRSECELFLLEGKSTGGGEDYDDEHQGVYLMQGKPSNVIKGTNGNRAEVIRNVLSHEILADIFAIINYDPRKPDISKLYFSGVRITADADKHGGHIAALVLTAFQAVAPELVNMGFVSVIVPPYYRITLGKNEEQRLYIREKSDLPQWCAHKIFIPRFELKIRYHTSLGLDERVLNVEEYCALTDIVFSYGLLIDNVSSELSIEPELLEALCRCTHYLTPQTMDVGMVREATGCDHVVYHADTNLLVVTFQEEDVTIPLLYLRDRIYGPILGMLQRLNWMVWQVYITTLKTPTWKDHPISLYQLYRAFKMCRDSLINIDPLKGLGSMTGEDLTRTCLDPRNRKEIKVTSVGDVQRILRLMEKDSAARKQLSNTAYEGDLSF